MKTCFSDEDQLRTPTDSLSSGVWPAPSSVFGDPDPGQGWVTTQTLRCLFGKLGREGRKKARMEAGVGRGLEMPQASGHFLARLGHRNRGCYNTKILNTEKTLSYREGIKFSKLTMSNWVIKEQKCSRIFPWEIFRLCQTQRQLIN